jgi:hypothetical protein
MIFFFGIEGKTVEMKFLEDIGIQNLLTQLEENNYSGLAMYSKWIEQRYQEGH